MSRKPPSPAPSLALRGDLDLFSIQAQWEVIRTWMADHPGPFQVDLSGIGDLDLSGVQLLLALERQVAAQGRELSLTGLQPGWSDRFRALGLPVFPAGHP